MKKLFIRLFHPKMYQGSRWVGTRFRYNGHTYKVVKDHHDFGSCHLCDLQERCAQAYTSNAQGFCMPNQRPDCQSVFFVRIK